MSRHTTEELIARWRGERITTEQMIGQLLLAVQELEGRQRALERRLAVPQSSPHRSPRRPLRRPPPAAESEEGARRSLPNLAGLLFALLQIGRATRLARFGGEQQRAAATVNDRGSDEASPS